MAIGHNPAQFISACEAALALSAAARQGLTARMRAIVAATSWTNTAQQMRQLIDAGITAAAGSPAAGAMSVPDTGISGDNVNALRPAARLQNVGCAIIGAGPTGLSAAYHLGADTLLLERHATVGG